MTLPRKAAAVKTRQATTMLTCTSTSCRGFWMARPMVNSRESPGMKKVNSPHSAKMTTRLTQKADGPSCWSRLSALSQSGPRVCITGQRVCRRAGRDLVHLILGHHATGAETLTDIGVGPWVGKWPDGPELSLYDESLLAEGDRRNVVDKYRYWRHEAIVDDLDAQRHDFHVAVENWGHDFNIGSVIRTANAFNAKAFHIVGKRRWNRRGAMVTDRYQHEYHHASVEDLIDWAAVAPGEGGAPGIPVIGIDNLPGSQPIETFDLPRHCILLFGQEGPGLSPQAREASVAILDIGQFRSTRSINAGAAAPIAM